MVGIDNVYAQNYEKKITFSIPHLEGKIKCYNLQLKIQAMYAQLLQLQIDHHNSHNEYDLAVEKRLDAVDGSDEERRLYGLEIDIVNKIDYLSKLFDTLHAELKHLIDYPCVHNTNKWHRTPTFGLSHNTNFKQLVKTPLLFNQRGITIDNNFQVEFPLMNQTINTNNSIWFAVNVYDGLKFIELSLGIPEVGEKHKSSSNIVIYFDVDYSQDVIYQISEIVHEQKENYVNQNMTSASIQSGHCVNETVYDKCYLIGIDFVVKKEFDYNVFSISAVDTKRRVQTVFFTDGVSFFNPNPEPEPIIVNEKQIKRIEEDMFFQSMERINSNFYKFVEYEKARALQIWNGTHFGIS